MKKWWILLIILLLNLGLVTGYRFVGGGGGYYTPNPIGDGIFGFYEDYAEWINFFLYLIFFFSVVKMSFGDKRYSDGVVFVLGIALALSLVFWEYQTGHNLITDFGAFVIAGVFLFLFYRTALAVKKHVVTRRGFFWGLLSFFIAVLLWIAIFWLAHIFFGFNVPGYIETGVIGEEEDFELLGMPLGTIIILIIIILVGTIGVKGASRVYSAAGGRPSRGRGRRSSGGAGAAGGGASPGVTEAEARLRDAINILHAIRRATVAGGGRPNFVSLFHLNRFHDNLYGQVFDQKHSNSVYNIVNDPSVNFDASKFPRFWRRIENQFRGIIVIIRGGAIPTRAQYDLFYNAVDKVLGAIESRLRDVLSRI